MSALTIHESKLPNGVRLVMEHVPYVQSAAIGIWVKAGSRYEEDFELGISHVLEHMLFKGTEKRTAKQIAEEIEALGGYFNAFTDKEMTCYYGRILSEHSSSLVDVLCDMLTNSIMAPDDISSEVKVVLEEIKRRDDDPEDLIHDVFLETLWPFHQLGRPVIGTVETVSAVNREKLFDYMKRRYASNEIVISAAGNLDFSMIEDLISDRLGSLKPVEMPFEKSIPTPSARKNFMTKEVEQVNFCLGSNSFSQHEDDKYPMAVLDTILGGGMSSRLFQEIREKRGLAYSIGSSSSAYDETGYFMVYGGTSEENFQQVTDLTMAEFDRVKNELVTDYELMKAKNHIRGSLLLSLEGMSSRMMRLGKNVLYFDRIIPIEEIINAVDKVKKEDLLNIANKVLDNTKLTTAAIGPFAE